MNVHNGKTLPNFIVQYNKYMGGVNKFDQMVKYYPLKRKTNRWPHRFSLHILQILLHNSYVLYKQFFTGKKLKHYDYHAKFIGVLLSDEEIGIQKT
jgi:hypothetical protein